MGKIFCIIGKSSSGKDTLYKKIIENGELSLLRIVPYTTRPMRSDETDGKEYFFTDEAKLKELTEAGRVIEVRAYHTIHGVWKYFTVNDGQIDLTARNNYLMIATLEAYEKIRDYFGASFVVPVYVEVEDGLRLQRALKRERLQASPGYAEMCRRFLADESDFSEDKIREAGILQRFSNEDLDAAYHNITAFIRNLI